MSFSNNNGFSLYIHVPFCVHKCPYCDFNTYAVSQVPGERYTEAVLAEIDLRLADPVWSNRPIRTIFFGGGTPSLLSPELIGRILTGVGERATVLSGAEITLEANPGQASVDYLVGFAQHGVNRVSFGAQSFSAKTLKTLGRLHVPADITAAVMDARSAGIESINIDLIFGVPGQSEAEWRADLSQALELNPNHLSMYGLTIEQGTPLHAAVARKDIIPLDDELALAMMHEGINTLTHAGFVHYEVSNFAKPGYESRHNLSYWDGVDYLGIGAGAHSFTRQGIESGVRWSNILVPDEYIKRARASGTAEGWRDALNRKALQFEFFFLGLRKRAGVSLAQFERHFGQTAQRAFPGVIEQLCAEGHGELVPAQDGGFLFRISSKGLPLTDSILERFA